MIGSRVTSVANVQNEIHCKPKRLTDDTTLICWLSTVIRSSVGSVFYLSNITAWNLSGFTTILLFLNQSMTTSDLDSNILINLKTAVTNADRVLSSSNHYYI